MSFGELHRIQCEIGRQADEITRARSLLNFAMMQIQNSKDDATNSEWIELLYRRIKEAHEILTKIAK